MKWKLIPLLIASAISMPSISAYAADDFINRLPNLQEDKAKADKIAEAKKGEQPKMQDVADLPPLPNVPNTKQVTKSRIQLKSDAYEATKDGIAPMSPEMVREFRKFIDAEQRAKAATPYVPPRPVVATLRISTDPGVIPPVVRLAGGFVTSLVFVDSTGAEWPITKFTVADPDVFHVEQPSEGGNVVTISTISAYAHGNIGIHLKGQSTPVMVTLVSGQKEVDYRADMHVEVRGPNAIVSTIKTNESIKLSSALTGVLDGVPPADAKPLLMNGEPNSAWVSKGKTYIRTRMTLLSPGWIEHVSSPDGMNAYQIPDTPVLLLSSKSGDTVQVQLKEQAWDSRIQAAR